MGAAFFADNYSKAVVMGCSSAPLVSRSAEEQPGLGVRCAGGEGLGLTLEQQLRSSVSVALNIAEGAKRLAAENKNFLRYSLGSIAECDTQLMIAERLGYGKYSGKLKAAIMSLTVNIWAYIKSIKP